METLYIDLCSSGINDIFSTLAYYINYYKERNWDLNNIFFSSKQYENLLNYLDINTINYVLPTRNELHTADFQKEKSEIIDKYDVLHFHKPAFTWSTNDTTNLNIGTNYHLSNFIKLKPHILEESLTHVSENAIHLRFMDKETNNNKCQDSSLSYKKNILKLIECDKLYTIVSASPAEFFDELLASSSNIKYRPKQRLAYKDRIQNTKDTFLDLAILSQSRVIYKTEGRFTDTAKMFGGGLPVIKSLNIY